MKNTWVLLLVIVDYLMSEIEKFIWESNLPKCVKDFYIPRSLAVSVKLKAMYKGM